MAHWVGHGRATAQQQQDSETKRVCKRHLRDLTKHSNDAAIGQSVEHSVHRGWTACLMSHTTPRPKSWKRTKAQPSDIRAAIRNDDYEASGLAAPLDNQ